MLNECLQRIFCFKNTPLSSRKFTKSSFNEGWLKREGNNCAKVESRKGNQQSTINNQQSTINNQQSTINNNNQRPSG